MQSSGAVQLHTARVSQPARQDPWPAPAGCTALPLTHWPLACFPPQVGVAYRMPDGSLLPSVPSDLELLEQAEVRWEGAARPSPVGFAARQHHSPPPAPARLVHSLVAGVVADPALAALPAPQVVYETLPGWQEDISKCRAWEDLPENARR